jgi:4-aminobutyrate aminotransferase-like enzyme
MQALRKRCTEQNDVTLDEIQAGFGRPGKLWGFESFEIFPDVLILEKH